MNPSTRNPNLSNVERIGNQYWLLIPGKPSSVQARSKHAKAKLTRYKQTVGLTASQIFRRPIRGDVHIILYHFHKGTDIDLDNIHKPILDSLTGIAYHDDNQVESLNSSRVNFKSGVTSTLIPQALANRKGCVVIGIKPPD